MFANLVAASLIALSPYIGTPATAPYIGTTEYGGDYGYGSVFSAVKGERTTLYSFCSRGEGYCYDGANPAGGTVMLPDGSFVGTTTGGGSGAGTLFRMQRTPDGLKYQLIWDACWVFEVCDRYGTPRGTLQFMETNRKGYFIVEGVCESKRGRGVLYQLTVAPTGGYAILPLKYWGRSGGEKRLQSWTSNDRGAAWVWASQ